MDAIRRTDDDKIEAYLFEQHIDVGGIDGIKTGLASAPGVEYVAQFVGAFNVFARVVADDLGELQRHIAGEYFDAGVRSAWSVNLTASRPMVPKRVEGSAICALVCAQTTVDPFGLLDRLDEDFGSNYPDYSATVVTASDFDVIVALGAETIEQVRDLVVELRKVPGIGRTSTALADLTNNAIRPTET